MGGPIIPHGPAEYEDATRAPYPNKSTTKEIARIAEIRKGLRMASSLEIAIQARSISTELILINGRMGKFHADLKRRSCFASSVDRFGNA